MFGWGLRGVVVMVPVMHDDSGGDEANGARWIVFLLKDLWSWEKEVWLLWSRIINRYHVYTLLLRETDSSDPFISLQDSSTRHYMPR